MKLSWLIAVAAALASLLAAGSAQGAEDTVRFTNNNPELERSSILAVMPDDSVVDLVEFAQSKGTTVPELLSGPDIIWRQENWGITADQVELDTTIESGPLAGTTIHCVLRAAGTQDTSRWNAAWKLDPAFWSVIEGSLPSELQPVLPAEMDLLMEIRTLVVGGETLAPAPDQLPTTGGPPLSDGNSSGALWWIVATVAGGALLAAGFLVLRKAAAARS